VLKVVVIPPETSLLVVLGCGLGRGSNFSWVGLDWASQLVDWVGLD